MFEPLIRMIRGIGTTMAVVIIVSIIMLAFGVGESALGKMLGSGAVAGFIFLRYFGSNALHAKVESIVEDKAESIFGSLGEAHSKPAEFDADEAFARYMKKRDAGLTEPPPPDIGAIQRFGRKGQ